MQLLLTGEDGHDTALVLATRVAEHDEETDTMQRLNEVSEPE
jgi:hypothetical protein